ncbi:isocitrate lyase/phosphoenolpyruvate mutase family protein [Pelagibius litoralis]|uniref:Isocitrate lyase/phosphoenolpyruvate mutase family protein n=1 Tax=Pelagibius litoralis TaxID=374515 RepID=A0A967EV95_9PROT|nr:isocitrate lyase/phosphoenolpyruvate mutase family protein [Pelagibius litoralis]NIA68177.1 isocitrate lyase/phosphoenolpyruvate mutase family protein [Pelagibius litoralis]
MTQAEKARAFADLHVAGTPLVLYNIWDAGGAKAIAKAGAKALATGSWSVAAAQGYGDGQAIPLDQVLQIVSRIAATVDLPLTVDFEGGYAEAPEKVAANVSRVIEAGAVGINFEDQIVGGSGLHTAQAQSDRIAAVRQTAEAADMPLFINARTDLFLKEKDRGKHADLIAEAKERARAYAGAGASGFFVPGLVDPDLIGAICAAAGLPVNVMMMEGAPATEALASLGVARISYGPGPYFEAMARLAERFREVTGGA